MLRSIILSAAILTASASAASADSFFFGWGDSRPVARPVYVQPAPVVQYWRPGPVYYSSAPVYYGQPRHWGHRNYYARPAVIAVGGHHHHHDHYDGRGRGRGRH